MREWMFYRQTYLKACEYRKKRHEEAQRKKKLGDFPEVIFFMSAWGSPGMRIRKAVQMTH